MNKPKLVRVQNLEEIKNLAGDKTLSVDYMGHWYLYDKQRQVIYWKQLQPAIVGWGFTIKEN